VHPGAVLETYRETSANITPQPPPEPIQLEALPPPDGEEKIPKPTEKTPPAVEAQEPTEAGPSPYETTLVVRDGENLSKIIIRNFGMYDKIIEQEILKVNPDIKNPDLVYPDQTITIPSLLLVPKR
jgi:nucleoid-associated protein YgaU